MSEKVAAAKVETVCVDAIKPASSRFSHPKTYRVSLLDQIIPSYHFPLVFFYLNEHGVNQNLIHEKLHESLSKALSQFYPLAGTISNDGLCIDCNDYGAIYVETRVDYNLQQLLATPNYEFIHKLVPDSEGCTSPIMIQVNFFKCGGLALTFSFSHRVMDGSGAREFLKAWATYANHNNSYAEEVVVVPNVITPGVLFPQNSSLPRDSKLFKWPTLFQKGDCATRRFVFDGLSLLALKDKAISSSLAPPNPTRIEVVSALLWKCAAKARHSGSSHRSSMFSQVVNLRRRMSPNPNGHPNIGNLLWLAVAQCLSGSSKELDDYGSLVGYLREGIKEIDSGFIEELQGEGDKGCLKVSDGLNKFNKLYTNEGFDTFFSATSIGMDLYEADLGWGIPIWVIDGTAGMDDQSFNFYLMDTRHCDGIEVWVSLSKREMAKFECDPEILAFASLDPSPLNIAIPMQGL